MFFEKTADPFGMVMDNRKHVGAGGKYRFGFNSKENDGETVATGEGTQDYGMRIYNPAIGRWFSTDQIQKAFISPYQFALDNPINILDADGNDEIHIIVRSKAFVDGFGRTNGPGATEIKIVKKDGPDEFIHHNIVTVIKAQPIDTKGMQWYQTNSGLTYEYATTEVTVNFLHPNDMNASKGVTQSKSMAFDGLITWDVDDPDRTSVGKFMFANKEFSDYLKARNNRAKDWELEATGHILIDKIFPVVTKVLFFEIVPIPTSVTGTQRVGQWMTKEEYASFLETGTIPRSNVLTKGAGGYEKQAAKGDVYVEFDMDASLLFSKDPGQGWFLVKSKNATHIKLAEQKGTILAEPKGTNIELIKTK